jgi:hypothetical protein
LETLVFRISAVSAVAVCALAASGCGGHSLDDSVKAATAVSACIEQAELPAEAAVIRRQVAAGNISKARVASVFPQDVRKTALQADGNLRPYDELHGQAMTYYDALRTQLEATPRWHAMLFKARQDAFQRVKHHCYSLA